MRRNKVFRDRTNPLESYDDFELYQKFRFRREDILEIVEEVREDLLFPNRLGATDPLLQVLIALRFYATGTFHDMCGELVGVSKATANRLINRLTSALVRCVPNHINFPDQREADRQKQVCGYQWLPQHIPCIDCTHVRLQRPRVTEEQSVNRKNYHSLNVQASVSVLQ